MDRYEYKLKTEQMLELMEEGAYGKAAELADTIDWRRVRSASMLMNVSDIYEKNKDYQQSYEVLKIAYHRAEGSRKIIYKLCTLALKTRNVDEAIDFYEEFLQVAPKDPNRFVLRYQILRAQKEPIEQQIEALESFKKAEYVEEWAYELAKLYHEAGMTAECLEECDDLILWFSEGEYVYKAMELKMRHRPLTPSQKAKYDHRNDKVSDETEEIPDLTEYAEREKDVTEKNREETQDVSDADAVTDESEEQPVKEKKRKLGNTMQLGDALKALLNLGGKNESEEKAEKEPETEEEDISELEGAIEEIESVADLELVHDLDAEKHSRVIKVDPDLEELKPVPLDDEEFEDEEEEEEIIEKELLTAEELDEALREAQEEETAEEVAVEEEAKEEAAEEVAVEEEAEENPEEEGAVEEATEENPEEEGTVEEATEENPEEEGTVEEATEENPEEDNTAGEERAESLDVEAEIGEEIVSEKETAEGIIAETAEEDFGT